MSNTKSGLSVKDLIVTGVFSAIIFICISLSGGVFMMMPALTFYYPVGAALLAGPVYLLMVAKVLSQRKQPQSPSSTKKAARPKPPPVKIWASVWLWRGRKFCWWMLTRRAHSPSVWAGSSRMNCPLRFPLSCRKL